MGLTSIVRAGYSQEFPADSVCVGTQSLFYAERSVSTGSVFEYDIPPPAGYIIKTITSAQGDSIWIQWGDEPGLYRIGVREISVANGINEIACASDWRYNDIYVVGAVQPVFERQSYRLCDESGVKVSFNREDFLSYSWSDASIRDNVILRPGVYLLTTTDKNRCMASSSLTALGGISALLPNDTIICMSEFRLAVTDASSNPQGTIYTWWTTETETLKSSPILSGEEAHLVVQDHNTSRNAVYWVLAEYEECLAGDTTVVIACNKQEDNQIVDGIIPNTITPNGDGRNDVWNLPILQNYPNCEVEIFDRWGRRVFLSKGYATPWDGCDMNGKALPVEAYYYIIRLNDSQHQRPITGAVHIIK
jgi:gliding motility-associated-like protein